MTSVQLQNVYNVYNDTCTTFETLSCLTDVALLIIRMWLHAFHYACHYQVCILGLNQHFCVCTAGCISLPDQEHSCHTAIQDWNGCCKAKRPFCDGSTFSSEIHEAFCNAS